MLDSGGKRRKRRAVMTALAGIIGIGLLILPVPTTGRGDGPWNLPAPTMGGKQVWRDAFIHAGWRIQENVVTGHFRLLDGGDIRRAWGTYEQCKTTFDDIRRRQHIRRNRPHLVLLIHGIGRSTGTFSDLREAAATAGFEAIAISYPSTRGTIEEHADGIAALLNRMEGIEKISFVTHSMGGLIARRLLAADADWQYRMRVGRIVMIASPNQGSAVAAWLKDFPPYQVLYGKAGQQLVSESVSGTPLLRPEFGIIAGGKGDGRGYNPLLPGDDDGTVTVAETRLEGAKDILVVPTIHAAITNHPRTVRATVNFLKFGAFECPPQSANLAGGSPSSQIDCYRGPAKPAMERSRPKR